MCVHTHTQTRLRSLLRRLTSPPSIITSASSRGNQNRKVKPLNLSLRGSPENVLGLLNVVDIRSTSGYTEAETSHSMRGATEAERPSTSSETSIQSGSRHSDGDMPCLRAVPKKSYKFPKNKDGRSCHHGWFERFSWLSYDFERDTVFCYECRVALSKDVGDNTRVMELSFMKTGFNNWKKGTERLKRHEKSQFHVDALNRSLSRATRIRVVQLLSAQNQKQQKESMIALSVIVSSIHYFCRSGQALQGHTKEDGNLTDLLEERSNDMPALKRWLMRRDKWLSTDVQNEIIEIMAHNVQRNIVKDVRSSPFFGIIADGTTDFTGQEQFTLCVRWVDRSTMTA